MKPRRILEGMIVAAAAWTLWQSGAAAVQGKKLAVKEIDAATVDVHGKLGASHFSAGDHGNGHLTMVSWGLYRQHGEKDVPARKSALAVPLQNAGH